MQRLKSIFRVSLLVIFISLTCSPAHAQSDSTILKSMDAVRISLLTCGPGPQIYSLYGHTAIRFQDIGRDQDLVVNYGMFSFRQKYFILRFVFGLTDYEMGIVPFMDFIAEYAAQGRWVVQQTVNLSREEKLAITQAIDENYQPANRVYRYNYFYDNCTTRARDMITDHIDGSVLYEENRMVTTSYRGMIHQWNAGHPWARLGNDLLLGVKADKKTDNKAQQFLPDSLRKDFDHALIINKDGSRRQLVTDTSWLLQPSKQPEVKEFILSPMQCVLALLIVTLFVIGAERFTKRILWGFDLLLLLLDGASGLILTAMIFSQHPTVSLNTQILLFTPLSLIFLFPVVRSLRYHRFHPYLKLWAALTASFLLLYPLQHYEATVGILALILLIRISSLRIACTKSSHRHE